MATNIATTTGVVHLSEQTVVRRRGVRKPTANALRVRDTLVSMAKRPAGVSRKELQDAVSAVDRPYVGSVYHTAKSWDVTLTKVLHRSGQYRIFASYELADAWVAADKLAREEASAARARLIAARSVARRALAQKEREDNPTGLSNAKSDAQTLAGFKKDLLPLQPKRGPVTFAKDAQVVWPKGFKVTVVSQGTVSKRDVTPDDIARSRGQSKTHVSSSSAAESTWRAVPPGKAVMSDYVIEEDVSSDDNT